MRKALAGSLLAAALVSGCGGENSPLDSILGSGYDRLNEASEQAPLPGTMPEQLPLPVRAVLSNAVSIEVADIYKLPDTAYGPGKSSKAPLHYASGVNLGNGEILTAGHVIYDESETGDTLIPQVATCGSVLVDAPTAEPTTPADFEGDIDLYGATRTAEKATGSFDVSSYHGNAKVPDWGLLQLAPNTQDSTLEPLSPPMVIRETPLTRGEEVYFVGYPSEGDQRRTPNALRLKEAGLQNGLDKPVTFGGRVAQGPDPARVGKVLIRTGYKSYGQGAAPHDRAVPGDSGELAVDSQGRLVGITSEGSGNGSTLGKVRTEKSTAEELGVNLSIDPTIDEAPVSLAFIQPVNPRDLVQLRAKLATAKPCVSP